VGGFFGDPDDGEVAETADVNADEEGAGGSGIKIRSGMNPHLTLTLSPPIGWERRGNSGRTRLVAWRSIVQGQVCELRIRIRIRREGDFPGFAGLVEAGGDEVVAEEGRLVIAGLAEVFLVPGFFVGTTVAKGLKEIVVGPFEAVVAGVGLAPLGFEFFEEALLNGVEDGDVVEAEMFGVSLVQNLVEELVEEVGGAAMGGDNVHAPAPDGAGEADGKELAIGGVEGEFVEDAVAAFAGLGVGVGTEGVNGATVVEGENVGGDFLSGVQEAFTHLAAGEVEEARPLGAIGAEEPGLESVAAADPGVGAVGFEAGPGDEVEGGGKADADLAGFDHETLGGRVLDPAGLVGEEEGGHGIAEFQNASLRALTRLRHPLPLRRARVGGIGDF
jgi:hypothetical protein